MGKAGIMIDHWKLSIFKRHLESAQYTYTQHPGVTKDTLLLRVEYTNLEALKPIIKAANDECARITRSTKTRVH